MADLILIATALGLIVLGVCLCRVYMGPQPTKEELAEKKWRDWLTEPDDPVVQRCSWSANLVADGRRTLEEHERYVDGILRHGIAFNALIPPKTTRQRVEDLERAHLREKFTRPHAGLQNPELPLRIVKHLERSGGPVSKSLMDAVQYEQRKVQEMYQRGLISRNEMRRQVSAVPDGDGGILIDGPLGPGTVKWIHGTGEITVLRPGFDG